MSEFLYIGLFIYLLLLILLDQQWKKALSHYEKVENMGARFSILIPFRNEGRELINLVHSLIRQVKEGDEIILVDDHSENQDLLYELSKLSSENPLLHVHRQKKEDNGKKAALKYAFNEGKNDYIIQLDADVRIGEEWLKALRNTDPLSDLYILPLAIERGDHFFGKMEEVESMALTGTSAVTVLMGKPSLISGANLLASRTLYESFLASDSGTQTSSGDDMFLLGFAKDKGYRIAYCGDQRAAASTNGNSSFRHYIRQRIRWASKMPGGKGLPGKWLAILVLSIQIFFSYAFLYFLFSGNLYGFFILWFSKGLGEFLFTRSVSRFFTREDWRNRFSYIGPLVYPFISTFIAIISLVYRPHWKGRKTVVKGQS